MPAPGSTGTSCPGMPTVTPGPARCSTTWLSAVGDASPSRKPALQQIAEAYEPVDAHDLDLARLVAGLPANQRRAFVLHVVFDLSVDDVAREMKAPAGTVRSWIHRARTALASQVESDARLVTRR